MSDTIDDLNSPEILALYRGQQSGKPDREAQFMRAWKLYNNVDVTPQTEYRFSPKRRFRADFAFPSHKLIVEIEGGVYSRGRHVRPQGYQRDCEKYNLATVLGWAVLRYTSQMLNDNEQGVIEEICQYLIDSDKSKALWLTTLVSI